MLTVLLATYNGEKYLKEQIESLLSQTYSDFQILIHDDGSTDGTMAIINSYMTKYPEKIKYLEGEKCGGACQNFSFMLSKCDSEYIMFCDQDDVWFPDKIEITMDSMREAERISPNLPVLVHGDLTVTDGDLNVIDKSFFHFQSINGKRATFSHLLVQNYVTGCTVMINRNLKDKCGEIPRECAMHDWWLALVCSLFGEIVFINRPLLYYRQHEGNKVGAKVSHGIGYIKRKLMNFGEMRDNYLKTYVQARILRTRYIKDNVSPENLKILNAYCNMSELGKIGRIKIMRRYDFRKSTKLRVFGQYIMI